MYLNSLDCVEKELFLELALNACYANGELDPNESYDGSIWFRNGNKN